MKDYNRWSNKGTCIGKNCYQCEFHPRCLEYCAIAEKELLHKKTKKEGPNYD